MTLHLTALALATRLGEARRRVAAWAAGHGMPEATVDDMVLATHEALANVADHAYPAGVPQAWVHAECCAHSELVVTVVDRGRWRPPPRDPGSRGHGMTIIHALAERVEIRRDDGGTSVTMAWSLPRPRTPTAALG